MENNTLFWSPLVSEGNADVEVEAVTAAFGTIEVVARGRAAGASCPGRGRFSDRVHDRYQRRLRDLPLADKGFVIRLTVRRFICGSGDCPHWTFAELFSRLTVPHSRFTTRLTRALERVGLALAGRACARLEPVSWKCCARGAACRVDNLCRRPRHGAKLRAMTSLELSDLDYLREIERLANRVSAEASNEGWLSFQADPEDATPLQRSVNALARALRHYHFDGVGCLDETGLWSASSEPRC